MSKKKNLSISRVEYALSFPFYRVFIWVKVADFEEKLSGCVASNIKFLIWLGKFGIDDNYSLVSFRTN